MPGISSSLPRCIPRYLRIADWIITPVPSRQAFKPSCFIGGNQTRHPSEEKRKLPGSELSTPTYNQFQGVPDCPPGRGRNTRLPSATKDKNFEGADHYCRKTNYDGPQPLPHIIDILPHFRVHLRPRKGPAALAAGFLGAVIPIRLLA